MQPPHRWQKPLGFLVLLAIGQGDGRPHRQFGEVREELVQWRVDEPDGHREPVHFLQDGYEVRPLEG